MIRLILCIGILVVTCNFFSVVHAVEFLDDTESSFAEKYRDLHMLLQKVTSVELAIAYKNSIDHEIDILRSNQTTSAVDYNSLSAEEKKIFIKKFQQNTFHCGEVTGVANEKRRILLQPELADILRESLERVP